MREPITIREHTPQTTETVEDIEKLEKKLRGHEMNTAKLTKAIFDDVIKTGERVDDEDLLLYL